jgi:uncharacterized phiE125 gp8 family phage protein
MNLTRITEPVIEPVSLAQAKLHLRVDDTAEDSLISAWITAARERAEASANLRLVAQELELQLDGFPGEQHRAVDLVTLERRSSGDAIRLVTPLIAVNSIKYIDTGGTEQTLAVADYQVDGDARPPRVLPAYDKTWPSTRAVLNAVKVRFTCGFAWPFTADPATDLCTARGWTPVNGTKLRLWNLDGALPAGLAALTDYFIRDASGGTFKLAATSGGVAIDITSAGTGSHFAGLIPESLRAAILLMIGHWHAHREEVSEMTLAEVPFAARNLLAGERVWIP